MVGNESYDSWNVQKGEERKKKKEKNGKKVQFLTRQWNQHVFTSTATSMGGGEGRGGLKGYTCNRVAL